MDFEDKTIASHDNYKITFGTPNKFKILNHDIILNQSTLSFEEINKPIVEPWNPHHQV